MAFARWTLLVVLPTLAAAFEATAALSAAITRGQLAVAKGWLDPQLLDALRSDANQLFHDGAFVPSGLTMRGAESNSFCAVRDRSVCVVTPELGGDRQARAAVDLELERLMERVFQRRLVHAEQYYSLSPCGSSLPEHMDEHHEATIGRALPHGATRRSVSYIVYLSPAEVAGGAFRGYCRHDSVGGCGSHAGNLQVGWLHMEGCSQPVFLDSWVQPEWLKVSGAVGRRRRELRAQLPAPAAEEALVDACQPLCRLYRLGSDGKRRVWLGQTIDPAADADFGRGSEMQPEEFVRRLRMRLPTALRSRFSGVSERGLASQAAVEVQPEGGTLLLFCSVCVPHEVAPVEAGTRLALAGWFHEEVRPYPSWYDDAFDDEAVDRLGVPASSPASRASASADTDRFRVQGK